MKLITDEKSKPEDVLKGSIELGLLYVQERRLDKADERFKLLEKKSIRPASMAGRLGQAVVLAYRDKKETAKASNDLVMLVVTDPFPKPKLKEKNDKPPFQEVAAFLAKHQDLYQAVSDALNRNISTLAVSRLDQPALELLRAPPRLGKQ